MSAALPASDTRMDVNGCEYRSRDALTDIALTEHGHDKSAFNPRPTHPS